MINDVSLLNQSDSGIFKNYCAMQKKFNLSYIEKWDI